MEIDGRRYRDYKPKRGIDGSYVGDQYPLCVDLPAQSFLAKGSKYRLLGGSKKPKWLDDDSKEDTENVSQHVTLDPSSPLYSELCNYQVDECSFSPVVSLSSTLPCHGIECDLNKVKTVEVSGIFYGK